MTLAVRSAEISIEWVLVYIMVYQTVRRDSPEGRDLL
jgi:hypothetical protein